MPDKNSSTSSNLNSRVRAEDIESRMIHPRRSPQMLRRLSLIEGVEIIREMISRRAINRAIRDRRVRPALSPSLQPPLASAEGYRGGGARRRDTVRCRLRSVCGAPPFFI